MLSSCNTELEGMAIRGFWSRCRGSGRCSDAQRTERPDAHRQWLMVTLPRIGMYGRPPFGRA